MEETQAATPSVADQINSLKREAEAIMREFSVVAKKIADLGFKMHANPDNTMFIFRDTRESYGELVQATKPPQMNGM